MILVFNVILVPVWPDSSYEVPMPYSDAWWMSIILDHQSQEILESTGPGFKSFGGWTLNSSPSAR